MTRQFEVIKDGIARSITNAKDTKALLRVLQGQLNWVQSNVKILEEYRTRVGENGKEKKESPKDSK